jgi:hypothetical protein
LKTWSFWAARFIRSYNLEEQHPHLFSPYGGSDDSVWNSYAEPFKAIAEFVSPMSACFIDGANFVGVDLET